jgi:hypothetical protein
MTRNHQLGVFHDSTSNLHTFLTEMCLPNEAVTIISPTFVQDGNYFRENLRLCCHKYRHFDFSRGLQQT